MQINIEPEDLSRLEVLIEKCRYTYHTYSYHEFSDEDDKFFTEIKMHRKSE